MYKGMIFICSNKIFGKINSLKILNLQLRFILQNHKINELLESLNIQSFFMDALFTHLMNTTLKLFPRYASGRKSNIRVNSERIW